VAAVQYNHLVVLADCTADDPQTSDMIILMIFTIGMFGGRSHAFRAPIYSHTVYNSAQPLSQMGDKSQPYGPYHHAVICEPHVRIIIAEAVVTCSIRQEPRKERIDT